MEVAGNESGAHLGMGTEELDPADEATATHNVCTYMYMYMCMCWKLLSNRNFKGPYLEAEVVEGVMGWLG